MKKKLKSKTLVGIEVVPIFPTAKTISGKTFHLPSSFTHSHLHTPLNMTATSFFLAIHYLTPTVTSKMTSLKLSQIVKKVNLSLFRLSARHLQVMNAQYLLLLREPINHPSRKKSALF